MKQHKLKAFLSGLVVVVAFMVAAPQAQAATFNVTATDVYPAVSGDGCTLREAIENVRNQPTQTHSDCPAADGNNDTINLPAGTITLQNDLDQIIEPVTIKGAGMGQTIISGNSGLYVGFSYASPGIFTLADLTIRSFRQAAIEVVDSNVTVHRVEIDGTGALRGDGYLVGIAALGSDKSLTVEDTYIHDLTSPDAPAISGIIAVLRNSEPADLSIRRTTIANIRSDVGTSGGIIVTSGVFDQSGDPGSANVHIENNTISNITSSGDPSTSSAGSIILSTGLGAGENNYNFNILNNTLIGVDHTNSAGSNILLVAFTGDPSAVISIVMAFANNIVQADSQNVGECSVSSFGDGTVNIDATSDGGNLLAGNTCDQIFDHQTDRLNVTTLSSTLGPLSNNGGYVPTMALLTDSPALDSGVNISGLTTDARGVARPQGAAFDSGAYEYQASGQSAGGGALLASTGAPIAVLIAVASAATTLGLSLLFVQRFIKN